MGGSGDNNSRRRHAPSGAVDIGDNDKKPEGIDDQALGSELCHELALDSRFRIKRLGCDSVVFEIGVMKNQYTWHWHVLMIVAAYCRDVVWFMISTASH